MSGWPITALKGHIAEVSVRKGTASAEILSITNSDGFVRSLDVFDKQVFSEDASNYKLVQFDDLAYNPSRINVGSVARCQIQSGGAVSPMYVVVRCHETLLPQFLLHFLKSRVGLQNIAHRCVGAVRFMLRFSDLEQIELPLPPVAEQARIVRVLDDSEALRRFRVQIDQKTERLVAAVIVEAFGPDPALTWPCSPLAELVAPNDKVNYGVVQPGTDFPGGVPLIRAGDIRTVTTLSDALKRISPDVERAYARSRLKGGEVLLSCVGRIGQVGLADSSLAGCNIARAVARIPVGAMIDSVFLSEYLKTPGVQSHLTREARTSNQPTLNIREIETLSIPNPTLELQSGFAARVAEIRQFQADQAVSCQRLDDLFESLLHRAFQGEL